MLALCITRPGLAHATQGNVDVRAVGRLEAEFSLDEADMLKSVDPET